MDLSKLSRVVSHALRHEPWLYELELDEGGWVPVDALLAALHAENPARSPLSPTDLAQMIAQSDKKRHELRDGRIRALYGHSTPQRLLREPAEPPSVLHHGTSPEIAEQIRREGLKSMGRQYVHLSVDTATAEQVGRRKTKAPVILRVKAEAAHAAGVPFYRGNDLVWLADTIPPGFIEGL
ncbi:MAG TPA: RNA 2'-phosphotransferase [Mycobacterium sp.]|nr:RNA 2'-phosphotransferase [Mycobacterium sp.]